MKVTIAGLGPTDINEFDESILDRDFKIYARTKFHNAINFISENYSINTFDYLYDSMETTLEVEEKIAEILIEESKKNKILYLVPGSPFSFEKSVEIISKNTEVEFINNRSTLDLILESLEYVSFGIDIINSKDFSKYNIDFTKDLLVYEIDNEYILEDTIIALSEVMDGTTEFSLVKDAGLGTKEVYSDTLENYRRKLSPNHQTSLFIYRNEKNSGNFSQLLTTTSILRSPDGCPWDSSQTHDSLKSEVIEECFELISAIEKEDYENLSEELGDLLYLICLNSEIASENGDFDIFSVINRVNSKLMIRHPNIFNNYLDKSKNMLENYDNIKYSEKGIKTYTDRLNSSKGLPAMLWAYDIIDKTSKIDFYFEDDKEIISKIKEEYDEVLEAIDDSSRLQEELGDLIFSIIILQHYFNLDPELSLRISNEKFVKRFEKMEEIAKLDVIDFQKLGKEKLNELWNLSKNLE